jgi:hypothetical protein
MPRSSKSRRASVVPTENENGVTETVSTATATKPTEAEENVRTDLPFEIKISPAEEGFKPDRSPAGRKRIPSPFEEILPGLKGQGWQNQPHDGKVVAENQEEIDAAIERGDEPPTAKYNTTSSVAQSNAKAILRELQKAVKHLNGPQGGELNLGLDVNVTAELVQFNVRDKQNRKPRSNGELPVEGEDFEDAEDIDSGDE